MDISMLNFMTGLLAAVATVGVLEGARHLRNGRSTTAEAEVASAPEAIGRQVIPLGRLVLSTFAGFFLGGVSAGFLEAAGAETIELGSATANLLIAGWTLGAWWFLTRRDAV